MFSAPPNEKQDPNKEERASQCHDVYRRVMKLVFRQMRPPLQIQHSVTRSAPWSTAAWHLVLKTMLAKLPQLTSSADRITPASPTRGKSVYAILRALRLSFQRRVRPNPPPPVGIQLVKNSIPKPFPARNGLVKNGPFQGNPRAAFRIESAKIRTRSLSTTLPICPSIFAQVPTMIPLAAGR